MDAVNQPQHYSMYKHPVIDLTEQLDNNLGNVCKYILRAPFKGKYEEDIRKSSWYLNRICSNKKVCSVKNSVVNLGKTYECLMLEEVLDAAKKKDFNRLKELADMLAKVQVLKFESKH